MGYMKKNLYLMFLFVTPLLLSACSDDDDDVSNNTIVGKWLYEYEDEDGDYESVTLVFNSNGSGTATDCVNYTNGYSFSATDSFNYTYDEEDNEITIVVTEYGVDESNFAFFPYESYTYYANVVNTSLVCKGCSFSLGYQNHTFVRQ